jgi:uncharacterized protein involved in high-affinity Fe2+ transport
MKILLVIVLVLNILFMIKNTVTYFNQIKINSAIHDYHVWCIYNAPKNYDYRKAVDYEDKRGYFRTLFRVFDWGYKNILSKEKYELIKDYINS